MTVIDTAMVLAAGLGTRMRPLTNATPKPLLEVGDRALLDRTLDRVEEVGVRRAVVNAHYLADQIDAHLVGRPRPHLTLSDETDALLETGGGVKRALPLLDREAFIVVNSDNIWLGPRALAPLLEGWRGHTMDALLLLVPIDGAYGHSRPGDFFLDDDRLRRRGEADRAPYVYTGAQILKRRLFDDAPAGAFSLNVTWDAAIADGRAYGVVHDGGWVDVGAPAGLADADALVRRWPRPTALRAATV